MSDKPLRVFSIVVQPLSDRWHGQGDWPPSPFRLFQAIVAGAYSGRWRYEGDRDGADAALRWIEKLPAPIVLAPKKRALATVKSFVPNNDHESGDMSGVVNTRVEKLTKAVFLESSAPFVYLWDADMPCPESETLAELCLRLHTFGHGVDAAYAQARWLTEDERETVIAMHPGSCARPSQNARGGARHGGVELPVPAPGSLESLHRRYAATTSRFSSAPGVGRKTDTLFRQPPKAASRLVTYDRPTTVLLFELRTREDIERFAVSPLTGSYALAVNIRDLLYKKLAAAYEPEILDRYLMGRDAGNLERAKRVRIVPLPSIGHHETDPSIRRIAVEVPPDAPFTEEDLRWALAGNSPEGDARTAFVEASDRTMLRFYRKRSMRWQTITPAVLPVSRPRGRSSAADRLRYENSLAFEVAQALRHAEVTAPLTAVRIQREPFQKRGSMAGEFDGGRFPLARLHHVEISFAHEVAGILSIGDGRWLGLGTMKPVRSFRSETSSDSPTDRDSADADPDDLFDDSDETSDDEE